MLEILNIVYINLQPSFLFYNCKKIPFEVKIKYVQEREPIGYANFIVIHDGVWRRWDLHLSVVSDCERSPGVPPEWRKGSYTLPPSHFAYVTLPQNNQWTVYQ